MRVARHLRLMRKKYYFHKQIFLLFRWIVGFVSVQSQSKASMRTRLSSGDFLTLTIWPEKSNITAEVIYGTLKHQIKSPINGIIFDFDGTLVGGLSTWIYALRYALSNFGIQTTTSELEREFRTSFTNGTPGSPWRKVFRHRCPDKEEEAWNLFFQKVDKAVSDTKLSSNFRRFLETTRKKGIKIGIVTFRTRKSVEEMLGKMDASQFFDVIVGSGDTLEEKPSPQPFLAAAKAMGVNPDECLVVGDEPSDILGGNRAGMQTIGVLSGACDRDTLKEAYPSIIVESVEAIPGILTNII